MNKFLLLFLIIFSLFSCNQKETGDKNAEQKKLIIIGHIDSIYSNSIGETREIWIHIPESYKRGEQDKKYPVLYLLDGDRFFYSITGMIRQLSKSNQNKVLPEMVVVGIPNTNRMRDLFPTRIKHPTLGYGGGDNFSDFIEDELIPYVEKTYPVSSYRTIMGHSLAGVFVANTLISKPYLFENYISIDPSFWHQLRDYADYVDSIFTTDNFRGKSLYVAIANTLRIEMELSEILNDKTESTENIRSTLKLVQSLQNNTTNELNFDWKYYENEYHGKVPLIAGYDGFNFVFQWLKFNDTFLNYVPTPEITVEELLELPKYYEKVSKRLGYKFAPHISMVDRIGNLLLEKNMPDKAAIFFDMNVENYPDIYTVHNSRGNCYLAQKDTLKAIEFFNTALVISGNENFRKRIERLEESMKN